MRIRFSPSGRAQFLSAIATIMRDDPQAARRFRQRCERALRRLQRFPRSGRAIPEFPDLPFREVIVAPYRFFYRTEGKTVWVVAVWHGRQLVREPAIERMIQRDLADSRVGGAISSKEMKKRIRRHPS